MPKIKTIYLSLTLVCTMILVQACRNHTPLTTQADNATVAEALHAARQDVNNGEPQKALERLSPLARARPQHVILWNDLGNVFAALEDWHQAAAAYQRASEMDPTQPMPWYNAGYMFERAALYEDALSCYQKAYRVCDPENHAMCYAIRASLASVMWQLRMANVLQQPTVDEQQRLRNILSDLVIHHPEQAWRDWAQQRLLQLHENN